MKKIFIDGSAGTTGLRIAERLGKRQDLELLRIPEALRKNPGARREFMNRADVVFLCLPDDAVPEAVSMLENPNTAVIDTSTVHRTAADWVYGFPELHGQRNNLKAAKRIANPGCHASGFIALIAPLVQAGVLAKDAKLSCFSITGYSGGGKKMIAEYETENRSSLLNAPRMYGLTQTHKHLPEMVKLCGLKRAPVFCPIVADFYAGMEVTVSLFAEDIPAGISEIREIYRSYYQSGVVRVTEEAGQNGFLSAAAFSGRDDMEISVCGNAKRILLVSRFDNLGKGTSGAAIQNMNLLLGVDETCGMVV